MKNVLSMLEEAAAKYPRKVAVADQNSSVSYEEYLEFSLRAGSAIACRTGERRKPVIVLTGESLECLIAFMGILYSGNFYVPLDGTLPEERLIKSIEAVNPVMVVDASGGGVSGCLKELGQIHVLQYGDLISGEIDRTSLDETRKEISVFDPLFGMFTSGSTGKPKLVVKNHFSVLDMVEQFTDIFGFSGKSIFGNQAPFYFDVSAKDIYLSMRHGATMHVLPRSFFVFPAKLIEYINSKKINTLIWSAFAIRLLEKFKVFKSLAMDDVELVMFSGEKLSNRVLGYWRDNVDAKLVNLYGTTETTFNCTYHIIDKPVDDSAEVPIGKSFQNNKVLLLGDNDVPASVGERGEICVMGSVLAMGYYGDIERTSASFVQNPLNSSYPETMYRTGDIGFLNDNGEIVFVSRMDNQIKHMGHRIELEEIECAANNIERVDLTCCLYDKEKERILLYYQADEPMDGEIFKRLRAVFPKHMLPNRLYFREALPLNRNGKVDRNAVKETDIGI